MQAGVKSKQKAQLSIGKEKPTVPYLLHNKERRRTENPQYNTPFTR